MTPVEQSPRHYQGPEQPKAPPMPTMPPASELIMDPPGDFDDAPPADDPGRPMAGDDIRGAFQSWSEAMGCDHLLTSEVDRLRDAFEAGAQWQRDQMMPARPHDLPLEGTLESRTIVAALQLFREQVLVHNPEEVKTGEWLNARDVEVLIHGIRTQAAKGR